MTEKITNVICIAVKLRINQKFSCSQPITVKLFSQSNWCTWISWPNTFHTNLNFPVKTKHEKWITIFFHWKQKIAHGYLQGKHVSDIWQQTVCACPQDLKIKKDDVTRRTVQKSVCILSSLVSDVTLWDVQRSSHIG